MPASRRVSSIQLEELVAWMEAHPRQARATQLGGLQGKQSSHNLWDELASRLNAVGDGVTKTSKEWRQYWSDQKCKIKKQGSAITVHSRGTGGGPALGDILTPIEERILGLMGVENVVGNKAVRIDVDMGLENSPPQLHVPPPPVYPVPPIQAGPSSAAPTPAGAESGLIIFEEHAYAVVELEIDNEPAPLQAPHGSSSSGRPKKRKHAAQHAMHEDATHADDSPIGRPQTGPPRWALNLENRRINEEEIRRKLEERRLALDERRLALDEKRFEAEKEWRERQFEEEREWNQKRLALDERRLTLDEEKFKAEKEWREKKFEEERVWRERQFDA